MQIEIPFKTPTINHLYGQHGFHKYLKPEAKKLKQEIIKIITAKNLNLVQDKPLAVEVYVYENWYTKAGEVYKKDISNREKFLIDSVFEALEVDDKYIFSIGFTKMQSKTEEKVVIDIEVQ